LGIAHTSAAKSVQNKTEDHADECTPVGEHQAKMIGFLVMDEGRKRAIGIMAAILASLHMRTADDLFGGPQGSPRTDNLIAASIQWAEKIMERIDATIGKF
jgi:hypothetical protein